jgi:hypothetical protein
MYEPKVETGIPYVERRGKWDYPYDKMDIGDSFQIPISVSPSPTIYQRIFQHNQRHPETQFRASKTLNGDGEKATRVWRIR